MQKYKETLYRGFCQFGGKTARIIFEINLWPGLILIFVSDNLEFVILFT